MSPPSDDRPEKDEPDVRSFLKRALSGIPDPKAAAPPGKAAKPGAKAPAARPAAPAGAEEGGDMLRKLVDAMKRASPKFGRGRPEIEAPPEPARPESPTGNEFVDRLIPGAVRAMRETGVPASVSIAMAVLESGWGQRPLARDYNNAFGLRGSGPLGSVFFAPDGEGPPRPGEEAEFRRYADIGDSVVDHARMLASSAEYRPVMSVRDQPERFARALAGRYSPLPHYGETLVRIMRQFDLYRFDRAI